MPIASFPPEAKPYFSPYAILSAIYDKMPLNSTINTNTNITTTTSSININVNKSSVNVPAESESEPEPETVKKSIENAILDYVTEFQQLIYESEHMLLNTNTVLQKNQINLNRQVAINQDHINERQVAMHNYLDYRTKKDPAKYLLSGAFGKNWTDGVLPLLFPPDEENYSNQIIS